MGWSVNDSAEAITSWLGWLLLISEVTDYKSVHFNLFYSITGTKSQSGPHKCMTTSVNDGNFNPGCCQ